MARGRPTRSRPVDGEASSNQEASSPQEQTAMHTQTAPSNRPVSRHITTSAQPQNEVVAQLLMLFWSFKGPLTAWMAIKLPNLLYLH